MTMKNASKSSRQKPNREVVNHPFIAQVVKLGSTLCDPASIILFGSRARGDEGKFSDFDIAFRGVRDQNNWAKLLVYLQENGETLNQFDLILYEEASQSLRDSMDREGLVIYEKSK